MRTPPRVKVMVNSWASRITNGVIMERVVLRVAAEIGKITLWSHSEGITTNLIESSSPWKRITGKAIKIRFNHWQELWSLSKGRRRTFEAIFSLFWDNFLSDQWIRDAVRGYKIEFKEIQFKTDYLTKCLSWDEKECFSVGVGKLLGKGATSRASFDPNQFLSNLFTIPKKGDELRPINLKPLNHWVPAL